jgi:hypothetical protein
MVAILVDQNSLKSSATIAVQSMIGWMNPRSCRVLLVETRDAGQVSGWLRVEAGVPVLELEVSQSGSGAVVVMGVFRR